MTGTYSPELVGLSLVVAVAASYVAFALAAHITATRGWAGAYWLAGGAVALGTGIWSMHFIGMLAFKLPIPISYRALTTAASLLVAIIVSGFALHVISRPRPDLSSLAVGSATMGVGIALMHYIGMAAMCVAPPVSYDTTLVAASVVIAVTASALALSLAFRLRGANAAVPMWQRGLGALAMGTGISAMHFTGMAAARFAPGTVCTAPGFGIDQHWLAIAIAAATLIFLAATMLILTIDVRLAHQLDAANARIAALAREDPLTSLANRRTFLEHLDAAFSAHARSKIDFAVLFIDLDGFKDINDTLGHAAGDALIVEIAKRLKRTVRRNDVVARLGGDEFAILQTNVNSAADVGILAEKIAAAIAEVHTIGHDDVTVTASIGVVQMTEQTSSPADLMVQADLALYRAKDEGRNRYRFHDSALDRQVHLRALLARELQAAIARGELELLYKPQVHIASGAITGLETAVRWNHPSRGVVKPEVFVPIAERAGVIRAVADWAFDEACAQLRRWQDNGLAPPVLAVDVFAGQLKAPGDLGGDLKACLDRHGIDAARIELEFDESMLQATQRCQSTIDEMSHLGFRIAITSYGSGCSSLSYLARAPVQRLKIARAIVANALEDIASAKAARAIVNVAREIEADVIADGVDKQVQATFLLAAGCEQGQGPFFGPLLSGMEATLLLRSASAVTHPRHRRAPKSSAA